MNAPFKPAAPPEWNLADLYLGRDDPRIETDLAAAKAANDELASLEGMFLEARKEPQRLGVLLDRGIILVYERAIPAAKVDGVVFKLKNGNPVIGLSLRYARLDHYWFTLMHELAHVVLHDEQLSTPIVDDLDVDSSDLIERQANRLAANSMIPSNLWRTCPAKASLKVADVISFAIELRIAPHIVAGRLRRELGRHEVFTDLAHSVNVREMLLGED